MKAYLNPTQLRCFSSLRSLQERESRARERRKETSRFEKCQGRSGRQAERYRTSDHEVRTGHESAPKRERSTPTSTPRPYDEWELPEEHLG